MKILSVILFFLLISSSCYYTNDEIFYQEIDIDNLPSIQIKSNFDTLESVTIIDSVNFKYEILLDTGRVFLTRLYLDDYYIYVADTLRDSIWINPTYISANGHYELAMEVYYKTTTGSLADNINAEFLVEDTTWIVNINWGGTAK